MMIGWLEVRIPARDTWGGRVDEMNAWCRTNIADGAWSSYVATGTYDHTVVYRFWREEDRAMFVLTWR